MSVCLMPTCRSESLCEHIQKQVPDFVFLDAPVGKDPDQRNYIVSNAKIEATGFKPIIPSMRESAI